MTRFAFALVLLAACSNKAEPVPDRLEATTPTAEKPEASKPEAKHSDDPKILDALPLRDLVGYVSGNYHTGGNNPAIYADTDRKVFVMSSKAGYAELPFATKAAEASAAFEAFLLDTGYKANGKEPGDTHQKVMVNGKEMVVMTNDELFPKMPADLRAHFTDDQYDLLYHSRPGDTYQRIAKKYPVLWCYSGTIALVGGKEYPVAKANDAFAALFKAAKL